MCTTTCCIEHIGDTPDARNALKQAVACKPGGTATLCAGRRDRNRPHHVPIGVNLFVIRSVVPDISTRALFAGITPFVLSAVARVALLAAFPAISLRLPNLLFG